MQEELARWRRSFEPFEPDPAETGDEEISPAVRERLRVLGYAE